MLGASNVSIFYQNVRGLNTKTDEFYVNNISNNYDILIITETWLQSDICDSELFGNNYNVYRCDSSDNKKRGGVLIVIKRGYTSSNIRLMAIQRLYV